MEAWLCHVGGIINASGNLIGNLHHRASRVSLSWWESGASPTNVFHCRFRVKCRWLPEVALDCEVVVVVKAAWSWTHGCAC